MEEDKPWYTNKTYWLAGIRIIALFAIGGITYYYIHNNNPSGGDISSESSNVELLNKIHNTRDYNFSDSNYDDGGGIALNPNDTANLTPSEIRLMNNFENYSNDRTLFQEFNEEYNKYFHEVDINGTPSSSGTPYSSGTLYSSGTPTNTASGYNITLDDLSSSQKGSET